MAVPAAPRADVQRDPRPPGERTPELLAQLRIERSDPLGDRVDLVHEERPTREVERDLDQGFVERHHRARESAHAGLVTERFLESATEHDADILDGVMEVDVEI